MKQQQVKAGKKQISFAFREEIASEILVKVIQLIFGFTVMKGCSQNVFYKINPTVATFIFPFFLLFVNHVFFCYKLAVAKLFHSNSLLH